MVDVNKPVTNPDLVTAIKRVSEENTTESKNKMIDEVLKAHFLSPVTIEPKPIGHNDNGVTTLKENTTISFNMLVNTDNSSYYPAFTDWNELVKWQKNENQQTLITTFDDFASMILKGESAGFVINPHGKSVIFNRELISHIASEIMRRKQGGVVEQTITKDTQILLGQPKNYPDKLISAISTQLKKMSNVKTAYLFLMIKPENNEQSYLIAVEFDGDRRTVFDSIGKAAIQYLNGMYLDIVPATESFVADSIKNTEPFYRKKRFGIF